jgi:truncated hemoglobin YjbI
MPSLFEHAGGEEALHRLEDTFYASVLADPLLKPLSGEGQPHMSITSRRSRRSRSAGLTDSAVSWEGSST